MATLALIGAGKQELDKVKSYQLGAHVVGAELPHRLHEYLLRRRHQVLKQRPHAPGMRHERQSAPTWKMGASTSAIPCFVIHVALGVLQAAVHLGFRRTAPRPPAPTILTQPGLGRGQRGEDLAAMLRFGGAQYDRVLEPSARSIRLRPSPSSSRRSAT